MNIEELKGAAGRLANRIPLERGDRTVLVKAAHLIANPELIDIVFDGPPEHIAGRFVEVEDQDGHGIKVGEWVERDDGYWVLRLAVFTPQGDTINE